jgi:hypothetical protein
MDVFPINSTVSFTVPFIDLNGNPVTPTGLSYVVFDDAYNVLVPATALAVVPGNTEIVVLIGPTFNATVGARVFEFTITDAAGNGYTTQTFYGINPQHRLTFLINTFQTHAAALYLAQNIPGMDGWTAADTNAQQIALMESFARLIRMNFVIPYPEIVDTQALLDPDYYAEITPRMWPRMTPSLFARYPAEFFLGLRKAQVAEANYILTGDPIGDKIRSGLFSEKVGESSMMFRSGVGPLKLPLCREALNYLTGYLNNRFMLSRS